MPIKEPLAFPLILVLERSGGNCVELINVLRFDVVTRLAMELPRQLERCRYKVSFCLTCDSYTLLSYRIIVVVDGRPSRQSSGI